MTIFGEWVVGSKDQLTGVGNGKTVKNLKKPLELTTCSIDEAQVRTCEAAALQTVSS